jgi:hypothetical protein
MLITPFWFSFPFENKSVDIRNHCTRMSLKLWRLQLLKKLIWIFLSCISRAMTDFNWIDGVISLVYPILYVIHSDWVTFDGIWTILALTGYVICFQMSDSRWCRPWTHVLWRIIRPLCNCIIVRAGFFLKTNFTEIMEFLILLWQSMSIYRVSQEECARLREGVTYVKIYRYNPKHLCPKLNVVC